MCAMVGSHAAQGNASSKRPSPWPQWSPWAAGHLGHPLRPSPSLVELRHIFGTFSWPTGAYLPSPLSASCRLKPLAVKLLSIGGQALESPRLELDIRRVLRSGGLRASPSSAAARSFSRGGPSCPRRDKDSPMIPSPWREHCHHVEVRIAHSSALLVHVQEVLPTDPCTNCILHLPWRMKIAFY